MLISDSDVIKMRVRLPKVLKAPVKKGDVIGTLDYYVNGQLTAQMPVSASRDVARRSLWWYFKLVLSRYFYPYL